MLKNLSNKTLGILITVTAFSIFAFTDVAVKVTSEKYDTFAIALYMNIFTSLFLLPMIFHAGGVKTALKTQNLKLHTLRSYFMLTNFLCMIYAFSQVPITTAYTIVFCMPFIMSFLAMLLLKEKVSSHHWIAIALGTIGILIALRPGLEPISLGIILAFCGTMCNASGAITVKFISKKDHWLSYVCYMMIFQTPILMAINVYRGNSMLPDFTDWSMMPWFLAGGLGYAVALSLIPQALQRINASLVGALLYSVFIWGIIYGYFIFGDTLDLWTSIGAIIIILSGIYLIYREKKESA